MHDDALRLDMLRNLDDLVLGEDLAVQSVLWVDIKCEVDESSFFLFRSQPDECTRTSRETTFVGAVWMFSPRTRFGSTSSVQRKW